MGSGREAVGGLGDPDGRCSSRSLPGAGGLEEGGLLLKRQPPPVTDQGSSIWGLLPKPLPALRAPQPLPE